MIEPANYITSRASSQAMIDYWKGIFVGECLKRPARLSASAYVADSMVQRGCSELARHALIDEISECGFEYASFPV